MKIGLFGGSFNPIHNGHVKIAEKLLEKQIVDQVWIIPCGNHAFDKKLASGESRMKMIGLAIENNPSIKTISVELASDRKSYTSKTVAWFKKEFPHDFYFVIGADNLRDLRSWHDFKYLKNNVKFILIKREGFNLSNNHGISIKNVLEIDDQISSSQVRENLEKGVSIENLVPERVEEYIKKEGFHYG